MCIKPYFVTLVKYVTGYEYNLLWPAHTGTEDGSSTQFQGGAGLTGQIHYTPHSIMFKAFLH